MLTVWGRATSINVQVVMWAVDELGLVHRRIDAGGAHGRTDEPAYRAINPTGLVPALEDGPLKLFESAAILRYLAQRYGDDAFCPGDLSRRAVLDAWAEFAFSTVQRLLIREIFWQLVRLGDDHDPAVVAEGAAQLGAAMAIVERRLEGSAFLGGDALSFADIRLGAQLYRYHELDFPRPVTPGIAAYYDRLRERPAYRTHVMVPFDSLRGAAPVAR